jgi:hypothetical protein
MKMVHSHNARIDINLALEDLCYGSALDNGSDNDSYEPSARVKLQDFKERFCGGPMFTLYFEKKWEPCMGKRSYSLPSTHPHLDSVSQFILSQFVH